MYRLTVGPLLWTITPPLLWCPAMQPPNQRYLPPSIQQSNLNRSHFILLKLGYLQHSTLLHQLEQRTQYLPSRQWYSNIYSILTCIVLKKKVTIKENQQWRGEYNVLRARLMIACLVQWLAHLIAIQEGWVQFPAIP